MKLTCSDMNHCLAKPESSGLHHSARWTTRRGTGPELSTAVPAPGKWTKSTVNVETELQKKRKSEPISEKFWLRRSSRKFSRVLSVHFLASVPLLLILSAKYSRRKHIFRQNCVNKKLPAPRRALLKHLKENTRWQSASARRANSPVKRLFTAVRSLRLKPLDSGYVGFFFPPSFFFPDEKMSFLQGWKNVSLRPLRTN